MSATNGTGYQIEVYSNDKGWKMEYSGYTTLEDAEAVMSILPFDYKTRRVYESLEGY